MQKRTITFFNLGVLLALLLGFKNFDANRILDQLVQQKYVANSNVIAYNDVASFDETTYANKLETLGINLHPGTDNTQENTVSPSSLNHCKSIVYRTLESIPNDTVKQLKELDLVMTDESRRGLGGGGKIILRCTNVTDSELAGVLVHELGHVTDTAVLNGTSESGDSAFMDGPNPVYNDDPSVEFYSLSFKSSTQLKDEVNKIDFVSGYAMTDPFEDFAETYAYYILHGDEFREIMKYDEVLQKKYNFLKTRVFNGREYFNGSGEKVDIFDRQYDVTVLPYDMKKFFAV